MFEYTKHAINKFRRKKIRELGITRKIVESIIQNPEAVDTTRYPLVAVAGISDKLSLLVVYKNEKMVYKIITFFPAEKGRYESKILQRG